MICLYWSKYWLAFPFLHCPHAILIHLLIHNFQVTVPSMASVFNEYALKSQFDTSIYLQVTTVENTFLLIGCLESMTRRHILYCMNFQHLHVKEKWIGLISNTENFCAPKLSIWFLMQYLQNLFLYGYGAIFNFLAIVGIAIFKGTSSKPGSSFTNFLAASNLC